MDFTIKVAEEKDTEYAEQISQMYADSSKERGTGIAVRKPEYISKKILLGNAIIAKHGDELAGFCYIETFSKGEYVSNSGLIVAHKFRGNGLSKSIKKMAVQYARDKNPKAKLFGITTSDIVMKINSDLGYIPVSFKQLTTDEEFWKGCSSCVNYDVLTRNDKKMCLCTGMLAPSKEEMEHDLSHMVITKKTDEEEK